MKSRNLYHERVNVYDSVASCGTSQVQASLGLSDTHGFDWTYAPFFLYRGYLVFFCHVKNHVLLGLFFSSSYLFLLLININKLVGKLLKGFTLYC